MSTATTTPFYLSGNYAPVADEIVAVDLPVAGRLPAALHGRYVRNGPNPIGPASGHWFAGDGMLHGVALADGRACWYRSRWVRTPQFRAHAIGQERPNDGPPDLEDGPANTNIVRHAGRTLALVETSFPVEVTAELETVGPYDYAGRLTTAMTAHPKVCPRTGEMHGFAYGFVPPFLTYHRIDAQGTLVRSSVIDVPGSTMIHDFALTERNVVFMDLPVVFDMDAVMRGDGLPYRWSDSYGARVGVMSREDGVGAVRWFDVEPCYVFHTLNAFDIDGGVVVDVIRYPELWRNGTEAEFPPACLHRWTIDMAAGIVREQPLDDRPLEFPRLDERRLGARHRYGYAVNDGGVFRYDADTGAVDQWAPAPGCVPSEAVFVAAGDAEDEGWLLSYVYDMGRDTSDLVVLAAGDLAAGPVATVMLPRRVPFGFHGNWFPD
jgi:carotenoid cleavage dioxygenase-like enzyme